jgi:lipopolysaccharide/colanic/teichoic acid biosynthesis glycosyltransferase
MLEASPNLVPTSRDADAPVTPPPHSPHECGVSRHDAALPRRRSRFQYAAKRIVDVVAAGLGLLALSPLLLVVALTIRLDSKGPILFRQRRLGLAGQEFLMWKFRTMVEDAESRFAALEAVNEAPGGALFKIRHDPRVTRVGHFLRRTSLDELPQLLNILQGQMSLVGPRPLPLRDCERFRRIDAVRFERRLTVLPGLTGPWQVSGRSDLESTRLLDLDLEYVDRWNLLWDLRLIVQTVVVVLSRRGAY